MHSSRSERTNRQQGDLKMGSESAAGETASIFDKIAVSLGLSPFFVEISFIILAMIVILIVIVFLFAILRMRKEIISLNFKIGLHRPFV